MHSIEAMGDKLRDELLTFGYTNRKIPKSLCIIILDYVNVDWIHLKYSGEDLHYKIACDDVLRMSE